MARLKILQQEPVLTVWPTAAAFQGNSIGDSPPDPERNCGGPEVTARFTTDDIPGTVAALDSVVATSGWTTVKTIPTASGKLVIYTKQYGGWSGQLSILTDETKHLVFVEIDCQPVVPNV